MVVGGPIGASIGSFASGAIQHGQANALERRADAAHRMIPAMDPLQMSLLSDIRTKREMYESGMDKMTQARMRGLEQNLSIGLKNVAQQAGGDAGMGIDAALRLSNSFNSGMAQAGAEAQQTALGLINPEQAIVQDMADRSYKLRIFERDRLYAKYATNEEAAMKNMMGSLGMLPQVNWRKIAGAPDPDYAQMAGDLSGYSMGLGAPTSETVNPEYMSPVLPSNPLPTPTLLGQ